MFYWKWDKIAIYSRVYYSNGFSMPWDIIDIKKVHGTSEDEGEGWRTEDAAITVWEGRAYHSFFLWQDFFLISQRTTLPWPSLIDCTDTWINCAWKNLCCFVCRWHATYVEFVPLNAIRLQGWKQVKSN